MNYVSTSLHNKTRNGGGKKRYCFDFHLGLEKNVLMTLMLLSLKSLCLVPYNNIILAFIFTVLSPIDNGLFSVH